MVVENYAIDLTTPGERGCIMLPLERRCWFLPDSNTFRLGDTER